MTPIRKVSASKYDPPAARVRFRVKDSGTEGVLYQGQQIIQPCKTCPKPSPPTP